MSINPSGEIDGRRVVVVDGLRSPFLKSGTEFSNVGVIELGATVVAELIQRSNLNTDDLDAIVFGAVVPEISGPNIAREIGLSIGLPYSVDAFSVSRACATSTQSVVSAAQQILTGDADVVIAGGADTLSRPPMTYQDNLVDAMMRANAAKDLQSRVKAFAKVRPRDLAPNPPAIAERTTGETMGESAEKMSRENGITREAQDAFALRSHEYAAAAWDAGIYDDEVMSFPVPPEYRTVVTRDNIPRPDSTLEKLASLRPVFDRRYGTVTAGNSSPLTDGASAVILMEEQTAKRLGFTAKATIRSWSFASINPGWQLLMGPSFATPRALDRAGMTLKDIDIIDMHEAFAAQILSNVQAFESKSWAKKYLDRDTPIGAIDMDRFNIYGGSLSLGHPFGATGTRQILTVANELDRRGSGTALITQCAAGGIGAALVLER
jgi:acetyl-CoA acyltransferase